MIITITHTALQIHIQKVKKDQSQRASFSFVPVITGYTVRLE